MIGKLIPLHINSITGEIDELCYIELNEKKYIITHIHHGFMILKRVGIKQSFMLINTTIEHEFTFSVLFDSKDIPLKGMDFSLNRVVTYFTVLDAISEFYNQVVY